ncbi:MAG: diaminopimelate epimerase [Clostridia bacterium BRH_c25]|nr:MAG: diaminopimelate epimerase [Clostridia bacterium BRH_c25]
MKFYKYTGLGNDFVLMDNTKGNINMDSQLAKEMCNRYFGIGADGIVLAAQSESCDIRMEIYNSDGSIAEMCGNASRCFAKFCYEKELVHKEEFTVETLAGVIEPKLNIKDGIVKEITVDIGMPKFDSKDIPFKYDLDKVVDYPIQVDGKEYLITSMFMGVPHTVIFTDKIEDENVIAEGRKIEICEYFPRKTNVNFVSIINKNEIILRTWERGAGYTLACGTGACAAVVAGITANKLNNKVKVHLRGGDLTIEWNKLDNVKMTGDAKEVFVGEYEI